MTALALVALLEGLALALAPSHMKRAMQLLQEMPSGEMRQIGLLFAALGVVALFMLV
ncbi:MAG: DUF2065 family protein [Pseudomonadota bacterium]